MNARIPNLNAETIELQLDGRAVKALPGETLWEVALREGVEIPHLCHTDGLRPVGNCRACVVEVEGERALSASCCRAAAPGMKVQIDSPRAVKARSMVLELLVSDAGSTDEYTKESELTQWARALEVPRGRLPQRERGAYAAPDLSHPAIAVNLDACIQCTRCLRACREEQGNDVIGLALRGSAERIVFDAGDPLGQSSCVACGECVQACPTGALMPARGAGLAEITKRVDSVCPYCGVGCQLTWNVGPDGEGGERIHTVTGRDGPANHGRLCVKGRFGFDYIHNPKRLQVPLVRREGVPKDPADIEAVKSGAKPLQALFREASWEEALALAAQGFRRIRDAAAPGFESPLAGFGSAKGSNEEAYLFQKLVRQVLHSAHVDHCTRLCHASSVAALLEGIGSGAVSNPVADVAQAEVIFLIGANPTVNHPVAASFIKNAVDAGATLIVADPRRQQLSRRAKWHLQFRPDTDVALLNGLLHVIVAEGLVDEAFIGARVNGFEQLKASVAEATPERMAEICGIPAETIREVARAFATTRSAMILWGMGVSQHVHGTDNARALIALALITGQIGRPGTGLHPLRGQNNVQGASDAGLIPMMLPNYQRVSEAAVRQQFEALWGSEIDARPGMTVVEIMHAAHEGRIRGLFVEGENPAMSDPDLNFARQALAELQHLVVQDIFATETALLADVVLPASAQPEKWGTYTNTDRLIQIGRPALSPPGQAMQDLWVIEQIGRRLGADWNYWRPEDGDGRESAEAPVARVYEEMRAVMAPLAGVPWSRLVREDAVVTPAPAEDAPGQSVVFVDSFPMPDGCARLVPTQFRPGAERTDADYPFVLTTGRVLEHWHTGAMTRHASMLDAITPEALVSLHPLDAAALGVADGASVRLETHHGGVVARASVTDQVQRGQLFIPFAFWEAAANTLTGDALDAVAKIPGFKVTAARLLPQ
ncbi:formate dehydrogenase subunit alpha [uncultured Azohydromonas sp.]|jgi:formate dehydrogenase, alpha subunit, archaeal-type|uniref:formate dehydrogenase subunit alpha n=1 Tax=uncultured Azohydromonas sp. TaxID=487342 RepID=UPI0026387A41|nr:formate dehydrogenase subunit alpha [uncultured Azohydromonas sp.]